jgi:hypothetical protein
VTNAVKPLKKCINLGELLNNDPDHSSDRAAPALKIQKAWFGWFRNMDLLP